MTGDAVDIRAFNAVLSNAWVADWTKKCANVKEDDVIMLKWRPPGKGGWYVVHVDSVEDNGEYSHHLWSPSDNKIVRINLTDTRLWDGETACGCETWVALGNAPLHDPAVTAAAVGGTLKAPAVAKKGRNPDKTRHAPLRGPTSSNKRCRVP